MRSIGFSTGSLALSDFRRAIQMLARMPVTAIELSALRLAELGPLVDALDELPLAQFSYVSFHAPSAFAASEEENVTKQLQAVAARGWPIVIHPDTVHDPRLWSKFGELACIENMDKRKPAGTTSAQLAEVFDRLPDASFCFDVGHARQIDPSMCEAARMLRAHGRRLRQLHVSDVNSASGHERLNVESMMAFRRIAHLIPENVPFILETPVSEGDILGEMNRASAALDRSENGVASVAETR